MCPPVREGLESYLAGKPDANLVRHLGECVECRDAVVQFQSQSETIRSLRVEEEFDPAPGFYARVLERIEAQRGTNSIWNVFLEPLFGRRLMYATAVLTVLFGIMFFTSPKDEMTAYATPDQILGDQPQATQLVDSEADRSAVFVRLTSFQE